MFVLGYSLPGIEYVITQLKSLILSMGLIDRHITVEKAVLLSRLEEEYQVNDVTEQPYNSNSNNLSMTNASPSTNNWRGKCLLLQKRFHSTSLPI